MNAVVYITDGQEYERFAKILKEKSMEPTVSWGVLDKTRFKKAVSLKEMFRNEGKFLCSCGGIFSSEKQGGMERYGKG